MRLHRVKIHNITSLKGHHHIDLEEGLNNEDLFAITGPTGSGKSSILTAISLALYSSNYKTTLSQQDFVSLGENEASSELLFSIAGKKYLATWSCRVRKKNGELLKQAKTSHELFHEGKALPIRAEQVINLSFDQFCKSVILNQGEFSRFLISSFRERKDILEKLYDGEQLSLLTTSLKRKIKDLVVDMEKSQIKLDSDLPYTQEEINSDQEELAHLKKKWEKLQINDTHLKNVELKLKDSLELFNSEINTKNKLELSNQELDLIIKDLNNKKSISSRAKEEFSQKEKNYKDLSPKYTKALNLSEELKYLDQELKEQTRKSEDVQREQKSTTTELKKLQLQIKEINKKKKEIQSSTDLNDFTSDIILICQTLIREGKKIESSLKIHGQTKKSLTQQVQDTQEKIKQTKENLSQLNQSLGLLLKENNYKEQKLSLDKEKEGLLTKWSHWSHQYDQVAQVETEISQLKEELSHNEQKKGILSEKIKLQRQELLQINKEYELDQLLAATHTCLQESIKKGECVVCLKEWDSTPKINKNNSSKENLNLRPKQEEAQSKLSQLEKDEQIFILKIQNDQDLLKKKESLFLKTKGSLENALIEEFSSPKTHKKSTYALIQEKIFQLDRQREALENNEKSLLKLSQEKKALLEREEQLKSDLKNYSNSLKQLDNSLNNELSLLAEHINKIQEQLPHYPDQFVLIAQKFDFDYQQWNKLTHVQAEITGLEGQFNLAFRKEKLLLEQSKTEQERVSKKEERIRSLQSEMKELCPSGTPQEDLQKINKELELSKTAFEEVNNKMLQTEKRKEHTEGLLKSLRDQIKDIKLAKINTFSNFQSMAKEFQENLEQGNQKISLALEKIGFAKVDTEIELMNQALKHFQVIIHEYRESFDRNKEEVRSSSLSLEEKIKLFNQKSKQREEIQKTLKDLRIKQHRLQALESVIGKDEFRNFVLGLIEEQLILQTNRELNSLCDGRYELIQQEASRGHDFYIVDRWGGGLQRKVSTLSGGETFLVSLAMALSLAEMTRGRAEIDSFFIDEGFGSLDNDCIDEVLEVLMSIRNRGKQIGVISHIKTLTDRIPINIKIQKSSLGHSQVSLVYN